MGIFSKLIKKEEKTPKEDIDKYIETNNIEAISNYLLSDVKKEDIASKSYKLPLDKITELGLVSDSTLDIIKTATKNNSNKSGKIFRVTNLKAGDSLKVAKDGKTIWGSIKKADGLSTMAKFKEVKPSNLTAIDPTMLISSAALYSIEEELGEIKELTKKIISFLENEKQSQIVSDLELLKKAMVDLKYNAKNKEYMNIYHNQVMDIRRTASANLISYKNEIKSAMSKAKLFTTNSSMKAILDEIQHKFKYYRLSLFIYAYATYISIFLTGNKNSEYLLHKINELKELVKEYEEEFTTSLSYIKENANKSLESNVLTGLGSAGKAIGSLANKVKASSVDNWLNEKGDNLKQSGETIKNNYAEEFMEMKETTAKVFIKKIEKINNICNNTTEIYFDKDNIYLKMSSK